MPEPIARMLRESELMENAFINRLCMLCQTQNMQEAPYIEIIQASHLISRVQFNANARAIITLKTIN